MSAMRIGQFVELKNHNDQHSKKTTGTDSPTLKLTESQTLKINNSDTLDHPY